MMSHSASTDPSQGLACLMQNLSTYLDALAHQTQAIEQAVNQHLLHPIQQQSAAIIQLQSLDYLRQSLGDLAVLTLALSKSECSGELCVETVEAILQDLNLQDTKALVCPTYASGAFYKTRTGHGDIDLF